MKWRVYNMHPDGLTHKEKFRDDLIEIKANSYVLMDYEDAVQYRGQYFPMRTRSDGTQDPATYKVIKIMPHDSGDAKAEPVVRYVCHLDGKEFNSKAELEIYVKEKYPAIEPFRDESLDLEIERSEASAQKRGPGRPPKDKTL